MQLNNITNGHTIIINKIDINQNRVVYTEYEYKNNEMEYISHQSAHVFTDVVLSDFLSQTTNYMELCYTNLKSERELDEFEISDDLQNWLFDDRPYRIIIISSFILKQLQPIDSTGLLTDIGALIENEKIKNFGFYIDNPEDVVSILYVNSIDTDDTPTITPYLGTTMFIEAKKN